MPADLPSIIVTADGAYVTVGDRVFSHYTMKEHTIAGEPDEQGWFDLIDDPAYLNGERIVSLKHARAMHWLSPGQLANARKMGWLS